ncbi:ketoacyl-ACP synthase III [Paenibacillus sp. IB182496]|uniref:Beta-ketoacyl-[acyl-carrier-protein] synthase III n=1 Tax=Paenibacillus sabuli TaxID=2772509 RepID=A0A927BTD0_9BACL|nr:ketoacyl-ACP synthase III [Paenibacillus sabuli]MBD2846432.1 ketoacyl-ACP synthase III [Paenibacillus sabuli]
MHTDAPQPLDVRITAIGTYVPSRILTNDELSRIVDTSDEWIIKRTGIRERRIAAVDEYCSDLCFGAVRDLLARYPGALEEVEHILVATSTPDTVFPSMAARVQGEFGIQGCGAADLQAACAGFESGIQLASGLIAAGLHRKILVIGAETLSKITDYTDRTTCILFGDGAGAVLMEAGSPGAMLGTLARSEGAGAHLLYRSALAPAIAGLPVTPSGCIVQEGREVYKWALTRVPKGIGQLLGRTGLSEADIDWFVPHSANLRMIEAICERSGLSPERTLTSAEYCGNTSAASIPLALDAGVRDGRVRPGHTLLLYGFGGGLTEAAVVLRWTLESVR